MLVAGRAHRHQQFGRRGQETALPLHGLDDHGGNVGRVDIGSEQEFQCFECIGDRYARVVVRERQVVNARRRDAELPPVRHDLAGQGHGERGAAVKAAGEGDDASPASSGAGDLDGVFDSFRTGRKQDRLRFAGEWGDGVEPLANRDIGLIGHHLKGGMRIGLELTGDGRHHLGVAVAGVEHGDAAGEIHEAPPLNIPDFRTLGAGGIDRESVCNATRAGSAVRTRSYTGRAWSRPGRASS